MVQEIIVLEFCDFARYDTKHTIIYCTIPTLSLIRNLSYFKSLKYLNRKISSGKTYLKVH